MSKFLGTPSTVACQVPLSMGFARQEYWSGLSFPSLGFFFFFFKRTERANLKKSIKYSRWLRRDPILGEVGMMAYGCPQLAGLTVQDVGGAPCYLRPAVSPGWDKSVFEGDLYPVGSRTWGSEEGDVVAQESGPKGQKSSPPTPCAPSTFLRSSPSSPGRKLRLQSPRHGPRDYISSRLETVREKSEEF